MDGYTNAPIAEFGKCSTSGRVDKGDFYEVIISRSCRRVNKGHFYGMGISTVYHVGLACALPAQACR